MSEWLDPSGRGSFGIGICDRCKQKFSIEELYPDPNSPGLRVCLADMDEFDPYRLPARQTEDIALPFTRPDSPLSGTNQGVSDSERGFPLVLSGVYSSGAHTEALTWSVPIEPFTEYRLYKSVDGAPYTLLRTFLPFTNSYTDTGIDNSLHGYDYYVTYRDIYGVESQISNIVDVPYTPTVPVAIITMGAGNVYRSLDLETWTLVPIGSPALSAAWRGIAYAPSIGAHGRWVIINNNGITSASAYSDDGGLTWSYSGSNLPLISAWQNLIWDSLNSVFIACGAQSGGTATIYTSPDGLTWTKNITGARVVDYLGAAFDEVHGVAVLCGSFGAFDHNGGLTSTDGGLTWTIRTINDGGWGHVTKVQAVNGILVACGNSALDYSQSLDGGVTWSIGVGPKSAANAMTVLPDGSRYVLAKTTNAIDYAATLNGAYTNVPQGIVFAVLGYDNIYGFNKFFGAGTTKGAYSTDGVSWTNPAVFAPGAAPLAIGFGYTPP